EQEQEQEQEPVEFDSEDFIDDMLSSAPQSDPLLDASSPLDSDFNDESSISEELEPALSVEDAAPALDDALQVDDEVDAGLDEESVADNLSLDIDTNLTELNHAEPEPEPEPE
ncbi:hypothetical protein, partial [Vibrio genomosp. F10]|uniref:hypothetical protein n=1 Tax=Vibrio genomosp. F10 TaxID=723171 RepID=UPI00147B30DB